MRRITPLLCVLLLLCFCSCDMHTEGPATVPEATTTATEPDTLPKEEDRLPGKVIETKYYSLELYDVWADACRYEIFQMDSGLYILSLYETTAYEEFGGGKLCSIQLINAGDDTYKDFPSYEWLGELDTPDGRFNVIVLFPTDVQFSENTAQAYTQMYDSIHDVLFTLSPQEGVELAMPAPVP